MNQLTPQQLSAQVQELRKKTHGELRSPGKHYALHSSSTWDGPRTLEVGKGEGAEEMLIFSCRSDLEMRAAMIEAESGERSSILLCSADPASVSHDVLCRLAPGRIKSIETRQLLASCFRINESLIEGSVSSDRVLTKALIDHAPPAGYQVTIVGQLGLIQAWETLLPALTGGRLLLELPHSLLEWSHDEAARRALVAMDEELKKSFSTFLKQGQDLAGRMFQVIVADEEWDLLALGDVFEIIFHPDEKGHEAHQQARGQLRQLLGSDFQEDQAQAWTRAVATYRQLFSPGGDEPAEALEGLLAELNLRDRAYLSSRARAGLEQRYEHAAQALENARKRKSPKALSEADTAVEFVKQHELAKADSSRVTRLKMALRLVRYLSGDVENVSDGDCSALCQAYTAEGSWADQACHHLRQTERSQSLQAAYVGILKAVEKRSRAFARDFATQLQDPAPGAGLLMIEDVLEKVVAPLATESPVLVLVIDGMSLPVFQRLMLQLEEERWNRLESAALGLPRPILATCPSVTHASRGSLFSGTLQNCGGSKQVQAFAKNPALLEVSRGSKAPQLFLKGQLTGGDSSHLSAELRSLLSGRRQRILGIVINAIDDHLDSGTQDNRVWDLHDIDPLVEILDACAEGGRQIIFTSDHGHVLDFQTGKLSSENADRGDRHRFGDPPVREGEVTVTGPRVKAVTGKDSVTLAVDPGVRYGLPKRGYHGGAHPREMVIPLAILAPPQTETLSEKWQVRSLPRPGWWSDQAPVKKAQPKKTAQKKASLQPDLFTPSADQASLGGQVVASDIFQQQLQQPSNRRVDADKLAKLIDLLTSRGGTLTPREAKDGLGITELRYNGIMSAMAMVLNIDGYDVLSISQDAVKLSEGTLREQFEI